MADVELGAPPAAGWSPPRSLEAAAGWSWRLLVIAALASMTLGALALLSVVVIPLIGGLVLAAALTPLYDRLVARGWRPALASAGCVLLFIGGLALVLWLVIEAVIEPWDDLSARLSAGLDRLEAEAGEQVGTEGVDAAGSIRAAGSDALGTLLGGLIPIFSAIVSLVSTALLSLFVLFFFLKDGAAMWARSSRLGGRRADQVDRVGRAMWEKLHAFLRGTAMVAALDAIGISLGAWVLGVPSPAAILALTFVMAFIPYFGAMAAGLLACVLAVAEGGFDLGLAMFAVILVVQQIEGNFLQPVLVGSAVNLHPMVVALGVIAGGVLAGILGMFIAIPLIAAATAAVKEVRRLGAGAVPDTPPGLEPG